MQQTEVFIYSQRLELNKETLLTLEFFGKLGEFKALVVASLTDEARADEAEGDWKGLVTNMKDYFAKIMKNQKIALDEKEKEHMTELGEIRKEMKMVSQQMLVNEAETKEVKSMLEKILAKVSGPEEATE